MGGIMSSSPELMQTVQKFQVGGQVVDPYFARMSQQNLPAIRPGSFAAQPITSIQDFIGRANRESGIGQIQQANEMARAGVTPEDMARVQAAAQANQTANQTAAQTAAGQSPTLRGPTASQAQMGQNINMFENMMDAGSVPTMRGPTAEDVSGFQASQMPQRPGQLDSANIESLRGPTAEDVRESQEATGKIPTLRGGTVGDWKEFLSKTVPQVNPDDDAETLTQKGKEIAGAAVDVLKADDVSEEEKNNMVLEFMGKKDPEKDLTKKEQIEKSREFYREVFGTDPEKDKEIDGYNLAMMGFLIASGDSPNALQNIARGSAAGVKNFMKTAEKRRDRDDKITQLAVADYQSQVKSEAAREQWRLNYNLKVQELMDKRDQAESKTERENFEAVLSAVDDPATALVIGAMGNLDALKTEGGLKRLAESRKELIAIDPGLASGDSGFRDPRDPRDPVINFLDSYDSADISGKRQTNKDVAEYLGTLGINKDPKQVTDLDRERYARDRVARVYGLDFMAAPAPAPAPAPSPAPITVSVGELVSDENTGITGTVQSDGSVIDSSGNVVAPAGTVPVAQ